MSFTSTITSFLLGTVFGMYCSKSAFSYLLTPKTSVQIEKNHYDVTYTFRGKEYVLRVPIKKGPCDIDSVYTVNNDEVTDEVHKYFGPFWNHYEHTTPYQLGYNKLYFVSADISSDSYAFLADEKIVL